MPRQRPATASSSTVRSRRRRSSLTPRLPAPSKQRPRTHSSKRSTRKQSLSAANTPRQPVTPRSRHQSASHGSSGYSSPAKSSSANGLNPHGMQLVEVAAADLLPEPSAEDEQVDLGATVIETGPPPDLAKRKLIFDSLQKIVDKQFSKHSQGPSAIEEARGTFLWTFGAGYHGQLGHKFLRGQKKYRTVPELVLQGLDVPIRQVVCGGLHTAAVTDAGTVYTWGDGRYDQLGHAQELYVGFSNQQVPRLVDELVRRNAFITHVACGQAHTVAMTDRGTVFTWGQSKYGQLGLGERQSVRIPHKMPLTDPNGNIYPAFVDIDCGDKHTVAIAENGLVYSWGQGEYGQLGHGDEQDVLHPTLDKLTPTLVERLKDIPIQAVSCGSIHTVFLARDGRLFLCGFGEYFYPNQNQNFYYTPTLIPFHQRVVQVASGQSHILLLTDKGDVYAWGCGTYGQLGHGIVGNLHQPRLVLHDKNIAYIAAGRYHSAAITTFGALYTWGCGENGQLGHHDDENALAPRLVQGGLGTVVGMVSCGEHHTAMLSGAPWNQLPSDMVHWMHLEKVEYGLKLRLVKRLQHGLTKREHHKRVQHEMSTYEERWRERQTELARQAIEEQQRDLRSIRHRGSVRLEVHQDLQRAPLRQKQRQLQARLHKAAPPQAASAAHSHSGQLSSSDGLLLAVKDSPGGHHRRTPTPAVGVLQKHDSKRSLSEDSAEDEALRAMAYAWVQRPTSAPPATAGAAGRRGRTLRTIKEKKKTDDKRKAKQFSQQLVPVRDVPSALKTSMLFLKDSAVMVRRLTSVVAKVGVEQNTRVLDALGNHINERRQELDQLKHERAERERLLAKLERQYAVVDQPHALSAIHRQELQKLKSLEMKLETVTIKINETDENRKSYELNISHLKEEEFERRMEQDALRKRINENTLLLRKMRKDRTAAMQRQAQAEAELKNFRKHALADRKFLKTQMRRFKSIASTVRAKQRRKEALEEKKRARVQRLVKVRLARLRKKKRATDAALSKLSALKERQLHKLGYYEKRFLQITEVTGLKTADAIVTKFSLKNDITAQLQQEIQEKEERVAELRKDLEQLQSQVKTEQKTFHQSTWRDVETQQERKREATVHLARARSSYEQSVQRLMFVKEGLISMLLMLPADVSEDSSVPTTDLSAYVDSHYSLDDPESTRNQLLELLAMLEERAERLYLQMGAA